MRPENCLNTILVLAIIIGMIAIVHIYDLKYFKSSNNASNNKKQIVYNIQGENENWEIANGIYLRDIHNECFELGEVKYLKDMKNIKEITIKVILKNGVNEKKTLLSSKADFIEPTDNSMLKFSASTYYSSQEIILPDFNYFFEATIKYITMDNKSFEETIPLYGINQQFD